MRQQLIRAYGGRSGVRGVGGKRQSRFPPTPLTPDEANLRAETGKLRELRQLRDSFMMVLRHSRGSIYIREVKCTFETKLCDGQR
ncbi:hypothetical protein Krac_8678 [Ktedonobacter racemifer DSM 44963]|uniref:Uncharacterized protein n=1 Tax=Ktedonobacter racemifer DSM 44963 TaxID=485913 RepID=D6TNL6_KTERA|nr:hypothetical protein Krac_8678 [Ktedonobacter racemifer DSM 44963]